MKWKTAYSRHNYEVSDTGIVRRKTPHKLVSRWRVGRCLTTEITKDGYLKVNMDGRRVFLHAVVAETFICPRKHGLEVNHKDGDKTNNRVENLEWLTRLQNMRHAIAHDLIVHARGEGHGNAKLTEDAVREIRKTKPGTRGIAKKYGVHRSLIRMVRLRQGWRHV